MAVRLAKNGFYVFASVLHGNGSGAGLLRDEKVSNLHVIEIDVTNKAHIRNAISIVDNAGTGNYASDYLEIMSIFSSSCLLSRCTTKLYTLTMG